MNTSKIYIADHNSIVGSAILSQLQQRSDVEIITRSRSELDLTNQQAVEEDFFQTETIDQVYLAAVKVRKVGDIHANNSYPAEFIYQKECNIINSAYEARLDDSIDCAVTKKAANAWMVSLVSNSSDIGSWSALWDISAKDKRGNVNHGDVISGSYCD